MPQQPPPQDAMFRVTASTLNVRKKPSLGNNVIGQLQKDDIVEQVAPEDGIWMKIRKDTLTGWSALRYLVPAEHIATPGTIDEITETAARSAIAGYPWDGRGRAPIGYIKGMALVFARVYCKLKTGDPAALEMAKANTGHRDTDALAWYAEEFQAAGMSNEASGEATLRHLFVLLIGLGMRESSGKYCEGRDRAAKNTTAETAEAGLFQTSYNARSASPHLPALFEHYSANPSGFLKVFREGIPQPPDPRDLENFGSGKGRDFQKLSKECPAFAAEFAAVGLRTIRTHWGPINKHKAELRPECNTLLVKVQHLVDTSDFCPALLA